MSANIRRTHAVVQATQCTMYTHHTHIRTYAHTRTRAHTRTHTHTQILRETAPAEKVEPAPAPELYHSTRSPPRPAYFDISWPAARPAPQQIKKSSPQPAARTTPKQIQKSSPRRAAGSRGLRAETRPAQGLNWHACCMLACCTACFKCWLGHSVAAVVPTDAAFC